MCLSSWAGNVRALQALARDLALRSAEGSGFNASKFVTAYLKGQLPLAGAESDAVRAQAASPIRSRPGEISREQILDALEQAAWSIARAARRLGIDKSTLSRRLAKEPDIQLLAKTSLADLQRQSEALGADLAALARSLGIQEKLLARRLRSPS